MREIKFRAWDGKAMVSVTTIVFYPDGDYRVNDEIDSHYDNWPLMQFTGLKDLNGKDVYEGDVVKYWGGKGQIVFHNCAFGIWYTEYDVHALTPDVEIIGNIYETPSP